MDSKTKTWQSNLEETDSELKSQRNKRGFQPVKQELLAIPGTVKEEWKAFKN